MKTFAVSPANYLDWREQNRVFDSMTVIGARLVRISGTDRPESMTLTVTEADFFRVLGNSLDKLGCHSSVRGLHFLKYSFHACWLGLDRV
jgi:hypothetical protein